MEIPEEPGRESLADVMRKIAEARERADLVDGWELRRRIEKARDTDPQCTSLNFPSGRRLAYNSVLLMLDEMGV